ncbi:MAG TPA: serine/threonine-protein kinase [Pirellulales bacterium]|nr:serine/threonine-protein kinase [Pirellulales bacterium]
MSPFEESQTELDPPSSPVAGELLDDPRVLSVVEEYLAQLDLGRQPDRESYVNRYPELAGAVAQCLDGLDLVRAAGPRSSSGSHLPAAAEPPPRALGDFQIVRELGRGGMGVVYEAVQLSLGRRVALKVLPFAATFDSRQLQRFKNEAQAAALLHHTNIVPIYAVGCERGVHFYAMQLIEGHSLALLIRQLREQAGIDPVESETRAGDSEAAVSLTDAYLGGVVPLGPATSENLRSTAGASLTITARAARGGDNYFQKIARLILQAAEALEHAHQLGIVHRDIKPANLLVNALGTLWVADFGLAQFQAEASLTRTGDVVGTFRYMSPEQATGQRTAVDHRTDIYSLGATFYELLTLEPVFACETRHELLYQIVHGEPKLPRHINRAIPSELETIVLKAVRKSAAERYATAGEFAEDLRRYLDHRPILARRPTVVERVRKWSRRHPSVVVAGVLLLVATSVGLFVHSQMISREQEKTAAALDREKQRANDAERLFGQARQAVDLLVEVSEDELSDKFDMQQTRRRLLQTALGFYQDFIDERRVEAASQDELAAVEQRVAGILHELDLMRRGLRTMLLNNPVVVRELKLDDDQQQRIQTLFRTWNEEEKAMRSSQDATDEDTGRHQRFVAFAELKAPAIESVLTDGQFQRLQQLAWQAEGLGAFKSPEVVNALNLSHEQRLAIRKIERDLFRRRHEHDPGDGGGPGGPPKGRRQFEDRGGADPGERGDDGTGKSASFRQRHREAMAKVLASFSEEQLTRWHDLTGEAVDGLNELPFGPHGPKPLHR